MPSGTRELQNLRRLGRRVIDARDEATRDETETSVAKPASELAAFMPTGRYLDLLDSEGRKQHPMATGLLDYFPDALAMVSHVSWIGNEKHNPGEPLHHARGKSMDHSDCAIRHMSTRDSHDGTAYGTVLHLAEAVWRTLAELQEAMETQYNLDLPRGAWDDTPND